MITEQRYREILDDMTEVMGYSDEKLVYASFSLFLDYCSLAQYELSSNDFNLYKKYKSLGVSLCSLKYDLRNGSYGKFQPFNWNVTVSDGLHIEHWMKKTTAKVLYPNTVVKYLSMCFHDLYRQDMEPIKEIIPIIENLVNTKRSEAKEAGRLMMLKGIVEGDEKLFKEGADFSVKKRKRLFTPDDGIDHCVDIIGMLKLAHYNGLDFEYESEYVPQELVAYTPIDISDDPVFLRVKEAYRNEHPEIQAVWDEMEISE